MFLLRNVHRKVIWETKNGSFVIAANTPFLEPTFFKGIGLLWNVYYLLKINISMELLNSIVRPGCIDPMTAVVQRVKGFAYYSLSFSRHNKNIKMEHFFLYILSRYFIWLHKWKGFNDICASLKYERMIDYSFQLCLILYPLRCRETISLRGPVFHRSHGHNLVRPGHQSEVIMVMYLRFAVNSHVHNQRHG